MLINFHQLFLDFPRWEFKSNQARYQKGETSLCRQHFPTPWLHLELRRFTSNLGVPWTRWQSDWMQRRQRSDWCLWNWLASSEARWRRRSENSRNTRFDRRGRNWLETSCHWCQRSSCRQAWRYQRYWEIFPRTASCDGWVVPILQSSRWKAGRD